MAMLARGPGIVCSAYGGVLADRYGHRRLAGTLTLLQAIPAFVLAGLTLDEVTTVVEVGTLLLAIGVLGAFVNPVEQTLVPATVPRELGAQATSLGSLFYNVARTLGPLIGGGLVTLVGPAACFAINAVTFVVLGGVYLTLPGNLDRARGATRKVDRGLRSAATVAWRSRFIRTLVIGIAVFATVVAPLAELAPVIARRHDESAHVIGYLLAAMSVGGITGNLAIGWLARRGVGRSHLIGYSSIAAGIALVILGIADDLVMGLLAMFAVGVFLELIFVETLTWMQLDVPADVSGRMVGLFFAVNAGGVALGALLVGLLIDELGIQAGLAVGAIGLFLFGAERFLRPTTDARVGDAPVDRTG